jgi:hypothetical protein
MSVALESRDWQTDLAALEQLFGIATFVIDGVWAQFDVANGRVCLAGPDHGVGGTAVMLKMDDLEAARGELESSAWQTGAITQGDHEDRVLATSPSGFRAICYRPGGRSSGGSSG